MADDTYTTGDDQGMLDLENWRTDPIIWMIILVTGAWIIYSPHFIGSGAGPPTTDKADIMYGYVLLILLLLKSGWIFLKHQTPKLVTNPYHTTTSGKFRAAGPFALFRRGEIDAGGIRVKGRKGTIIVPIDSITKLGDNIPANVKTEMKGFNKLPHNVQSVIEEHEFKEPYIIGYANEEQMGQEIADSDKLEEILDLKEVEVTQLIELLEQAHVENTRLRDFLDKDFEDVEKALEWQDRLGTHQEGTVSESLKERVLDDNVRN